MTKFRADIEKVITVNKDSKEGKEINDKLLARYEKVRIAAEIFGNQSLTVSVLFYKLRSIIEDLFNIKKVMTFDYKEDEQAVEIQAYIADNGIEKAVEKYSGLTADQKLYQLVIENYKAIKA